MGNPMAMLKGKMGHGPGSTHEEMDGEEYGPLDAKRKLMEELMELATDMQGNDLKKRYRPEPPPDGPPEGEGPPTLPEEGMDEELDDETLAALLAQLKGSSAV